MRPQPHRVAALLGFDEPTIARLQARGFLDRLALTEPEIHERLYLAQLAYLRAREASPGGSGTNGFSPTPSPSRFERW
jgi:hypothetical protein